MSRVENFDVAAPAQASDAFKEDRDIQLWLKMGRMAFFFCLWASMVIPVALIYSFRF